MGWIGLVLTSGRDEGFLLFRIFIRYFICILFIIFYIIVVLCSCSGPEWPSGEPGEFQVGRSAPLINWAGRLACFFFFFFFFLHTQNNVYVFKYMWLITKLITLDLNLALKCDVFCCQSARALSLFLYTSACPRSLPWRQTETINAVVWVSESALITGRIKWLVKKRCPEELKKPG